MRIPVVCVRFVKEERRVSSCGATYLSGRELGWIDIEPFRGREERLMG